MSGYAIRDLFGIKGFDIAWYGIIITIGMMLGIAIAQKRAEKNGIEKEFIYDFSLIAIPVSILCARIYYVVFEWDQYRNDVLKIFAIREGGLAIFGGIIGGLIVALIYCKKKKVGILKFFDIAIPSLLIGQIIGRWGNFTNQEAYGAIVTNTALQQFPYAVYIERIGEWHQATFFYESFLNFILLIIILMVERRTNKYGYNLVCYLCGYGLIRVFVEGLRADSLYIIPGVRVSQMVAAFLVIIGVIMFAGIKRNRMIEPKELNN